MSIAKGSRIGRYEVISKLGVGGMGEVYKAHDTTLDRSIALKILPPDLVQDPDRVRRFVQEAKSASALSHPHIITIYEIGEVALDPSQLMEVAEGPRSSADYVAPAVATDVHYIAMEYIDGDTLHSKIYREKTDLKKLIEYLIQVADGLAKAHSSGIIHRDLKPENIMVTHDDYAKILDFGLAKLVEPEKPAAPSDDITEADTAIMQRTQAGVVMGTVGYMSPEQVQGKSVDSRSDIFSFGCVLHEAVTRHKPFEGESMIDTLHKIVYTPAPSASDLNPEVPADLQRIIKKCLAKDPEERYQSMKDVAVDLRQLKREYESGAIVTVTNTGSHTGVPTGYMSSPALSAPSMAPVQNGAKHRMPIMIAGIVVLVLGVGAAAYKLFFAKSHPLFENMKLSKLTNTGKIEDVTISPDGKYVVYCSNDAGQRSLWVRQVATSSNVLIVQPTQAGLGAITFSQDGNYVYYVRAEKGTVEGTLFQVPSLGGTPRKILNHVESAVSLSPDGKQMAFIRSNQREYDLVIANVDGSGEKTLSVRKLPNLYVSAVWSPDGKVIVCSAGSIANGISFNLVKVSVSDGTEKPISDHKWFTANRPVWVSDGSGLLMTGIDKNSGVSQIWFIPYPSGEPRKITNELSNYSSVSITSDSKAMVTIQANQVANIWNVPEGNASLAKQIAPGAASATSFSWTPDGRIVYTSTAGGKPDIWLMDADGSNQKQLTSDPRANLFPSVSPDGKYVVYCSSRINEDQHINIWRVDIDGGNPKELTNSNLNIHPHVTPDGKWVIYSSVSGNAPSLWKVPIDGGDPIKLTDRLSELPSISPDGKFIAYFSINEKNGSKPCVEIISTDGGNLINVLDIASSHFQWSADGKSILYVDSKGGVENIFSRTIDNGPPTQVTQFNSDEIFWFAWTQDGKQLACARGTSTTDAVMIKDSK